ncbi:MAG: VCBS repeat-containing protein [Candidatus Eisenbacteria sp.]|nr:VCBS repeat-containing protein [Candidatus Eisenbacteria bacterium]
MREPSNTQSGTTTLPCRFLSALRRRVLAAVLLLLVPAASSGLVTADSTYLLVDGQRRFIIGSYDLPPGLTHDDLAAAGFNFLYESMLPTPGVASSGLWRSVRLGSSLMVAPGHDPVWLIETIGKFKSEPGLLVWHGPDEPSWQGDPMNPAWLENGHEILDTYDDYFDHPHPLWINHACRGTQAHPDSFEILRQYLDCADIFSMDIYPVPESYEHSILPNKTISCVGEHTDILIDLVSDNPGRQLKPAWMVLQGFSWTDFFCTSEWYGTRESIFNIDRVSHAASGDVNGDGMADLVCLYSEDSSPGSRQSIKVFPSGGDRFLQPEEWIETSADSLPWERIGGAGCGDVDGDGLDDVVLWLDLGNESGVLLLLGSDGASFGPPPVLPDSGLSVLAPSGVAGYGLGDFDDDGLCDAAVATLVDTLGLPCQSLWVFRSTGNHLGRPEKWLEIPSGQIPFEQIMELRTGDFTGDGRSDICIFFEDTAGSLRLSVASSQDSLFSPAACWWDTTAADFPPRDIYGLTSQDLNGDGRTDLLLFYSQEDHLLNPQWFMALLSDGAHFYTERWGITAIGNYQFREQRFPQGGDFNGDGFGDFAALFDRYIPREDPYQVIRTATSYGEKFGVPGPSLRESRFMAYDAIIHGATGIIWWGLWYTGGPYAVWRGIAEVAAELSTLSGFLVGDDAPGAVEVDGGAVETLAREVGPYVCLVAANRADSTVEASLSSSWIGEYDSFEVLFEDRSLAPDGNVLQDRFNPYDVHVYLAQASDDSDPWPLPGEISIRPNPFTTSALFAIRPQVPGVLRVDIYDVRGRLVRHLVSRETEEGLLSIQWDGTDSDGIRVATGVYLCRFAIGGKHQTRKVVLIR